MFKNYLLITFRNLKKYKVFSFINIFGFSLALVPVILAFLFVKYEYSYDSFNKNYDRIYRVVYNCKNTFEEKRTQGCVMPAPFAAAMKDEFPEVKYASRVLQDHGTINYDGKEFNEEEILIADADFVKIFSVKFIKAILPLNLSNPDYILFSESMANKYFGNENPLGKTITYRGLYDLTVRGIYKDIPKNSHLRAGFIVPANLLNRVVQNQSKASGWGLSMYPVYYLLKENATHLSVDSKFAALFKKFGFDVPVNKYFSQPLKDIHLFSKFQSYRSNKNEIVDGKNTVYFYATAALIMLLIACINYINLSTARFSQRVKEISIRKIIGAQKTELIKQLLTETFVLTFSALFITLILVIIALPYFNMYVDRDIHLSVGLLVEIIALIFIISFLTGIYPALFVSSVPPLSFFRGKNLAVRNPRVRNLLVSFQFVLTIVFVFGTIIVKKQLDYATDSALGYNTKNILTIYLWGLEDKISPNELKDEIRRNSGVEALSFASASPNLFASGSSIGYEGKPKEKSISAADYIIDENFFDLYDMKIIKGRKFLQSFPSELEEGVIINETAVKAIGWQEPVGKKITYYSPNLNKEITRRVIGVVQDSHNMSFKERILPALYFYGSDYSTMSVKIKPGYAAEILTNINNKLSTYNSKHPFVYNFLDEQVKTKYNTEYKTLNVLTFFSLCAIIISCLGLLGVISFATEIRSKEIGIRKVLGASSFQVVGVLFNEMVRLMIISGVIAIPFCYYLMSSWLADFTYRIELESTYFIISILIVYMIASSSMVYQVIKASLKNPVDTLKYE